MTNKANQMKALIERGIPLLATWNCDLKFMGKREITRAKVKSWIEDAKALMERGE